MKTTTLPMAAQPDLKLPRPFALTKSPIRACVCRISNSPEIPPTEPLASILPEFLLSRAPRFLASRHLLQSSCKFLNRFRHRLAVNKLPVSAASYQPGFTQDFQVV